MTFVGAFSGGFVALQNATGVTLDAVRIFKTNQPLPFADVDLALSNDKRVYLSLGTGDQSYISAVAKRYADTDVSLAVVHEPESKITAAQFRDLTRAVRPLIPGRFGIILMGWTWDARSGRNPDEWIPDDVPLDYLGVDAYMQQTTYPEAGWRGILRGPLASAKARDLPLAIPEVGAVSAVGGVTVPELTQVQSINRLRRYAVNHPRIESVLWWEAITGERDYRISRRPLAAAAYAKLATRLMP